MQTEKPDEVLVVDNNSKDNTKDIVNEFKKKLPIRCLFEQRVGIPIARNTGLRNAKNGIIAFIDDDCVADKKWVENTIRSHIKKMNVACIQGKTICTSENIYSHTLQFIKELSFYYLNKQILLDTNNCSFKKEKIKNFFFDETFSPFNSGEDIDFGFQLINKGLKIAYKSNIIVDHAYRASLLSFLSQQCNYGRSTYHLKMKWNIKKLDDVETISGFLIIIRRLLFSPVFNLIKRKKFNKFHLIFFLYLQRIAYTFGIISYKLAKNKGEK